MLLTLSLGFFMTMLDLTIVNVAIPSIISSLHASLDDIGWVINGYVTVLAVLLITAGRLGDLRGPRNLFLAGVALFVLSSMACGFAQSPGALIAARAVQGLGAALLLPQTMTIIISTFPPAKRGTALGIWGAVAGVATVVGPTLGGLLVTAADWRWVFFINAPIGVAVIVMGFVLLPDTTPGRKAPLDLPGVVLASIGLVLLTFGLVEGRRYDWGSVSGWISIPLIITAGAVFLGLFVLQQARKQQRQPLVPFSLFQDRNYALMNGANVMVSIAMVGTFLPLSIYMQSVLGYSALKTGLVMAPFAVLSMCVAPVSGRLVDRIGGKYILLAGFVLFGAGILYVLLVARVDSHWYVFQPGFVIGGLGLGCTFGPMQALATYSVPPRLAGAASGVLNSVRQLGSVVGGLVVVTVLENRLVTETDTRARDAAAGLPASTRDAFLTSMHKAASAGVDAGGGPSSLHLPAGTPASVTHQVQASGGQVFTHAYVASLVPTLTAVVAAMAVGAVLCLAVRQSARPERQPAGPDPRGSEAPATTG
jgi:EmrB/QacA subfamily drug resistance transporter